MRAIILLLLMCNLIHSADTEPAWEEIKLKNGHYIFGQILGQEGFNFTINVRSFKDGKIIEEKKEFQKKEFTRTGFKGTLKDIARKRMLRARSLRPQVDMVHWYLDMHQPEQAVNLLVQLRAKHEDEDRVQAATKHAREHNILNEEAKTYLAEVEPLIVEVSKLRKQVQKDEAIVRKQKDSIEKIENTLEDIKYENDQLSEKKDKVSVEKINENKEKVIELKKKARELRDDLYDKFEERQTTRSYHFSKSKALAKKFRPVESISGGILKIK